MKNLSSKSAGFGYSTIAKIICHLKSQANQRHCLAVNHATENSVIFKLVAIIIQEGLAVASIE